MEYGTANGKPLSVCLVESKEPASGTRPVVAFIGWGRAQDGVGFVSRFARSGYLGVGIGYRPPSATNPWVDQIKDCKCALRFLRAKAKELRLDPERIGLWGFSIGGHLAAVVGASGGVKALEGEGGWPDYSSQPDQARQRG